MSKAQSHKHKESSEAADAQTPKGPDEVDENGAETEAEAASVDAEAEEMPPKEPEVPLDPEDLVVLREAELEAQVGELKDQLLRALAETENLRRRTQREREDTLKYASASLARDILGVADNLARAIESLSDEDKEDERIAPLLAGVELTQKELQAAFDRHHIVQLDPIGEKLDPHRHEAMFEVPSPPEAAGTIVQVIQPGYMLHDRLLRPARVGVAKAAKPATDASEEESS